ncbi:amidohydrolase family protein [Aurantiacibacter gangjinensis]|nr:amidohydrolase family protein [Aurantiacibacter gangjinensis]APE27833.1 Amidohydrolase family enzyme [Aurantiacibacter gangjinensis]
MRLILFALLMIVPGVAIAQPADRRSGFENVDILTMTDSGMIESGHVIVSRGVIESVGDGPLPAGFDGERIDGGGGVLMPGLADMHVHYYADDMGVLYLANSTTFVRNLTGSVQTHRRDQAARSGALIAPRVATSGPIIDWGEPSSRDFFIRVQSTDEAVGAVRAQGRSGYDAVKLYEGLPANTYAAAAAEAERQGMRVYTHVPRSMDVRDVLALGVDSIEHLDGYARALMREGFTSEADRPWPQMWANADRSRFNELVAATLESGTWNVPTFAITYGRIYSADPDAYFSRPEAIYLPAWADYWAASAGQYAANAPFYEAQLREKGAFTRALYEAGAGVLIGSDGPNPFVTPGYAIHDELRGFAQAGFSNAEILRIATVDAARFMGLEGRMGVVAEGARADLVLLTGDPHDDLAVLRTPIGTMVAGNWWNREAMDSALAARAARLAAEREQRAGE